MKRFISLALVSITAQLALAQNVGIGTETPHTSGILHIYTGSNYTKGLLISGNTHFTAAYPDLGPGSRMSFYPGKAAFRAGRVNDVQWDNISVGLNSAALGENNIASGASSFSSGSNNLASANSALATGSYTEATGFYSAAFNYQTKAQAYTSTAFGNNSIASGDNSFAMGGYTVASGTDALATGDFTVAQGLASFSTGTNTIASGDYAAAFGSGSEAFAETSVAMGVGTLASAHASLALGRYNIGAGNPLSWVATDPMLLIGNGTDATNRNNIMEFYKNGNLGIAGNYYQLSDATTKRDIKPLKNALDKIISISGYQYYWKNNRADQQLQTGILAQEVQTQMPELVAPTLKGNLTVNYSGLTPYLIEAVKELKQENDQLRNDLELLKKQMAELLQR